MTKHLSSSCFFDRLHRIYAQLSLRNDLFEITQVNGYCPNRSLTTESSDMCLRVTCRPDSEEIFGVKSDKLGDEVRLAVAVRSLPELSAG